MITDDTITEEKINNVDQSDNILVARSMMEACTLVHNEDLKVMLDCVVVHIQAGYKQRDATVQTINILETLYDKYRFKEEENNGKD